MSDFNCDKCGTDIENYNFLEGNRICFCPACGAKLPEKQCEGLLCKTTVYEIDEIITNHLLDVLSLYEDGDLDYENDAIDVGELTSKAWEAEDRDGTLFFYTFDNTKFNMRHTKWVDEALSYACDNYGSAERYLKMRAERLCCFLVVAFMAATDHFLFSQLGIGINDNTWNRERAAEIKHLIETTTYDGDF
jgi:hypothetical protein